MAGKLATAALDVINTTVSKKSFLFPECETKCRRRRFKLVLERMVLYNMALGPGDNRCEIR
jgi:hypothetical protein